MAADTAAVVEREAVVDTAAVAVRKSWEQTLEEAHVGRTEPGYELHPVGAVR